MFAKRFYEFIQCYKDKIQINYRRSSLQEDRMMIAWARIAAEDGWKSRITGFKERIYKADEGCYGADAN